MLRVLCSRGLETTLILLSKLLCSTGRLVRPVNAVQIAEMSLKCQRDSYLTRFSSRVLACEAVPAAREERSGYEVVLDDTILFPGGGGQPDDRGKISGCEVLYVTKRGSKAVHVLSSPLDVGQEVEIEVDWKRRFDHMQQHSGQHLITAVADREFGFKTTSWHLAVGEDNRCFVELETPSVNPQQLSRVEELCNEAIRNSIPLAPRWYDSKAPELEEVRSRGLPDDFEGGEVRVVEIEGYDANMCCGTHVSNLSHLQCIKLLYTEKKRGSTLVYYLTGGRALRYIDKAIENERAFTKLLSVGMDQHQEAMERMQKASRQAAKVAKRQLREIAQLVAFQHLNTTPVDSVACIYREYGDNEFMNIVANELAEKGVLVLVLVGGEKGRGSGQFLLAGREDVVAELGPKIFALLGGAGKGGGRKGRFQGKAAQLEKREVAEQLMRDFIGQKEQ